jgi:rod shape-determining protein MreB
LLITHHLLLITQHLSLITHHLSRAIMSFMRKTAAFMGFNSLREMVSDSMAIDMGSASTIIAVRGRGVVIDEPSVVAVNNVTGEVLAFGLEAQKMQGRESRDVTVLSPLVDGVVADFKNTRAMLDHFVREARSGVSHFSRRAVLSVLSGVTQVEERALLDAAAHAHISRVYMIEEGLAAAIGAGARVDDQHASAVVDIGGGTTNIAVVARGALVHSRAIRFGSADINASIIDHVRRHRGLTIGARTAEGLKLELATANVPEDLGREVTIKGRDVQTGSPGAIEITAGEVYAVSLPGIRKIALEVRETLTELPPEVAADIYDRGIILTGGGAQMEGLEEYIAGETNLPVTVADEPRFAIVRGLEQMYDEPLFLRRVTRNAPRRLVDAEASAFET